jgi:hypothetical protein
MNANDEEIENEGPQKRRRINPWLIVALVGAILAGILLASSVWTGGPSDEDKLSTNQVAVKKAADPQAWCAAQATYDAMKRELFRRAAQVRGSDEDAYARLSDFALLRVNGPIVRGVDDRLNSVSCSGTAVLSLPPGVAVAGGRRSLSGDIDYSIEPAADGTGNVVRLSSADAIVVPLATLARKAGATPAPAQPAADNQAAGEQAATDQPQQPSPQQPQQQQEPASAPASADPSFNCDNARTRSEIAICNDPGLASLDRQMAAQYNRGISQADRGQRRLLERTRDRFLSYRNRCSNNACIANTYRSRMREITDIMNGNWRG